MMHKLPFNRLLHRDPAGGSSPLLSSPGGQRPSGRAGQGRAGGVAAGTRLMQASCPEELAPRQSPTDKAC